LGRRFKLQEKAQKFKETMSSFPPEEKMTTMADNKKLYSEMNQMRAEQQALVQKMELLQEEAYKVAEELAVAQGVVKQATWETTEKLQGPITVQVAEELAKKEEQVKGMVATAKKTFQNFLVTKLTMKGEKQQA
jgi:hypothetical protein